MSRLRTSLPTSFELRLPEVIRTYIEDVLTRYKSTLIATPYTTEGKIVVEQQPVAIGGVNTVLRVLYTANFDHKKRSVADTLAAGYGSNIDHGYYESWMVAMSGRTDDDEFKVVRSDVYVHRDGGWELVHTEQAGRVDTPQATANGDVWPEAAGEPPANKGIINTIGARDHPELAVLIHQMLDAGAREVGDEIIVDMRNDAQRKAFWSFKQWNA